MANQVFESALATMTQAMGAVEAELQRLESFDVLARGIQQHIDALRRQESELKTTVSDLAAKIPAARQEIAEAEAAAKKVLQEGQNQKAKIVADGDREKARIIADARQQADKIVEDAKIEEAPYRGRIDGAKRELAAIKAQVDGLNAQADVIREALGRLKQSAAAFASS